MEWLIIKSEEQQKKNEPAIIEKILSSHVVPFTAIGSEEIERFNTDSLLRKLFKNITHVAVLDENFGKDFHGNLLQFGFQYFLIGFLVGKKIPSYCINLMHHFQSSDNFKNFFTEEDLGKYVEENFHQIHVEELSRVATEELLSKGIPVTAECFARNIEKENLAICKMLHLAGVDINSRDVDGTPLLNVAVRNENIEIVNWLLAHGADIDAVSTDRGYSAVMDAVWKSNEEIIKILVENGASLKFISKEGQSILVLAVGIGKESICKILAKNGADPDIKDSMGMSAYEYAVLFHREEIINALKPFHKE